MSEQKRTSRYSTQARQLWQMGMEHDASNCIGDESCVLCLGLLVVRQLVEAEHRVDEATTNAQNAWRMAGDLKAQLDGGKNNGS